MKKKFHTGGTVTGRFTNTDPEMQFLRPPSAPVSAMMARTKPFPGKGAKVIVESTPGLAGADFSEIEKRVMAQMGVPRSKLGKDRS